MSSFFPVQSKWGIYYILDTPNEWVNNDIQWISERTCVLCQVLRYTAMLNKPQKPRIQKQWWWSRRYQPGTWARRHLSLHCILGESGCRRTGELEWRYLRLWNQNMLEKLSCNPVFKYLLYVVVRNKLYNDKSWRLGIVFLYIMKLLRGIYGCFCILSVPGFRNKTLSAPRVAI